MKQVSPQISAHVRSEVTTLCTCWKLVRPDGRQYFWTDHDQNVTVGGAVYRSAESGGFDRSALDQSLSLDVTNAELVGYLGDDLNTDELNAGLFDGAELTMMLVNWADPGMGAITVRYGRLGEVVLSDNGLYKVELRGLQQAYTQTIGEVYTPECRAVFGDARCGIDIQQYTAEFVVTEVYGRSSFAVAEGAEPESIIAAPPGMLNFGIVRFSTGANAGKTIEIKRIDGRIIHLKFMAPTPIEPGDIFTLSAGCDQRRETCKLYDNIVNFRGEPFVPGDSAVFRIVGGPL